LFINEQKTSHPKIQKNWTKGREVFKLKTARGATFVVLKIRLTNLKKSASKTDSKTTFTDSALTFRPRAQGRVGVVEGRHQLSYDYGGSRAFTKAKATLSSQTGRSRPNPLVFTKGPG
jgi:hypothetical protein